MTGLLATAGLGISVARGQSGAPTITSFSPTSGPPGTKVTIRGSYFYDVQNVYFNEYTSRAVEVIGFDELTAVVPSNATTGTIVVANSETFVTSTDTFTVTADPNAPTITSFSPTGGPVGTTVIIRGTNFTAPFTVAFGGNVQAAGSFNTTQITVSVPNGAQTGPIKITTSYGSVSTATAFTVGALTTPQITSGATASGLLGEPFTYQIAATQSPTSYAATGLPAGLSIDTGTGAISGAPTALGSFSVTVAATNSSGTGNATLSLTVSPLPFFTGEVSLGSGIYYVAFASGQNFGEYAYLDNPLYIYSYDLTSYEYLFDAADGNAGIYFYDFASQTFFYTGPTYPYPYLYDFSLNAVLYYYQGTSNPRSFYDFGSKRIITK